MTCAGRIRSTFSWEDTCGFQVLDQSQTAVSVFDMTKPGDHPVGFLRIRLELVQNLFPASGLFL